MSEVSKLIPVEIWEKVIRAVETIQRGDAERIDVLNSVSGVKITVYSCGTIIRVDIK